MQVQGKKVIIVSLFQRLSNKKNAAEFNIKFKIAVRNMGEKNLYSVPCVI